MSFKIIEPCKKNKTTTINSNIVPCCEHGHGECKSVWVDDLGRVFCGDNCESDNDVPFVFWWDTASDSEFDFKERKVTQAEINAKYEPQRSISDKEWKLALGFLKDYSNQLGSNICNDWEFPENWTKEEIIEFVKDFYDWNGDPENFDENFLVLPDFAVVDFLAAKLSGSWVKYNPAYNEAELNESIKKGTEAWKDTPDDWLENLRGNEP